MTRRARPRPRASRARRRPRGRLAQRRASVPRSPTGGRRGGRQRLPWKTARVCAIARRDGTACRDDLDRRASGARSRSAAPPTTSASPACSAATSSAASPCTRRSTVDLRPARARQARQRRLAPLRHRRLAVAARRRERLGGRARRRGARTTALARAAAGAARKDVLVGVVALTGVATRGRGRALLARRAERRRAAARRRPRRGQTRAGVGPAASAGVNALGRRAWPPRSRSSASTRLAQRRTSFRRPRDAGRRCTAIQPLGE